MLSEILIVLAFLTLFCLFSSGDRAGPYELHYYDPNDDDFDHW